MSSPEELWLEYEGIGCPEIKYLNKSIENSKYWELASKNRMIGNKNARIGGIRKKLKEIKIRATNPVQLHEYIILSQETENLCIAKLNELDINFKDEIKCNNCVEINDFNFRGKAADDCLAGYLSVVVEVLINLIFSLKWEKRQEDCTEMCKVLMEVLISSQEYAIGEICFKQYISTLGPSDYSKNLHLYIKTIQTKSQLNAFGQLINLNRLIKYEQKHKNANLFFLIINQKAFCYAILGDWRKALKQELDVLKHTKNTFSKYICFLNLSRILLKINLPKIAIATLIRAIEVLQNLDNLDNYRFLIMLYISKAGLKMGIEKKINYNKILNNQTSNWRIAQALNQFSKHSNYCQLDSFREDSFSIELTSFDNAIFEIEKDLFVRSNIPELFDELTIQRKDSIYLEAYKVGLIASNGRLMVNIMDSE